MDSDNTWPFLPGHGAVWSGNKCILQTSTNLGNPGDGIVPALHCPGPAETVVPWNKSETTTDTWRAECGLTLENNQYYTSNVRRETFECLSLGSFADGCAAAQVSGTTVNALCPEDPPGSNNCGDRKGLAQPTWQEWTGADPLHSRWRRLGLTVAWLRREVRQ